MLQPRYNTGLDITDGTLVADSNADYSGTQGKDGWSYGYYEGVPPYNPAEFTAYSGGTGVDAWDGVNQFWTGGEDDQGGTSSKVVPGGPPGQTLDVPLFILRQSLRALSSYLRWPCAAGSLTWKVSLG